MTGAVPTAATRMTVATAGESPILSVKGWLEQEHQNLIRAAESSRWKVFGDDGTARLIGVSASTLSSRMKAIGIARPFNPLPVGFTGCFSRKNSVFDGEISLLTKSRELLDSLECSLTVVFMKLMMCWPRWHVTSK